MCDRPLPIYQVIRMGLTGMMTMMPPWKMWRARIMTQITTKGAVAALVPMPQVEM